MKGGPLVLAGPVRLEFPRVVRAVDGGRYADDEQTTQQLGELLYQGLKEGA